MGNPVAFDASAEERDVLGLAVEAGGTGNIHLSCDAEALAFEVEGDLEMGDIGSLERLANELLIGSGEDHAFAFYVPGNKTLGVAAHDDLVLLGPAVTDDDNCMSEASKGVDEASN